MRPPFLPRVSLVIELTDSPEVSFVECLGRVVSNTTRLGRRRLQSNDVLEHVVHLLLAVPAFVLVVVAVLAAVAVASVADELAVAGTVVAEVASFGSHPWSQHSGQYLVGAASRDRTPLLDHLGTPWWVDSLVGDPTKPGAFRSH